MSCAVTDPKSLPSSPALPGMVSATADSVAAVFSASTFSAAFRTPRARVSAAIRFLLPSVASYASPWGRR